jgi:hypothetical protein
VVGAGSKCPQRLQKCIAAALRDVGVVFDEVLFVRLIGDVATQEREFVFRRERLPHRIFYHRSGIAV